MSYEKYSTDTLVCGSFTRNTSDKTYLLFTREAGMVRAVATSVREERSKQRQALQDFSLLRVSLVPGKAGWRITGVEPISNLFMATKSRAVRGGVHALVQFVRRFAGGEFVQHDLYDEIINTLTAIPMVPESDIENLLLIARFRLLHQLGYIESHARFSALLTAVGSKEALAVHDHTLLPAIQKAVEQAATASQL